MTPTLLRSAFSIARSAVGTRLVDGGVRDALRSPLPRAAVETFLDVFSDPSLTWDDLAHLREWTSLPVLLKGVLHPDDASRALDQGVDGIVVSNHGGRQVDGGIATLDALPAIAEAVDGRIPVLLDSGIRSGADIFKALALGARAVLLGRPHVYGLALAGEAGVREVVTNFMADFDLTMGTAGYRSVSEIGPEALVRAMTDSHYPLQLLLYSAALHRYLRWRLPGYSPDRHLGGGLYLFVRGMVGAETPVVDDVPTGVMSWRPPPALVVALSDLLAGGPARGPARDREEAP